MKAAPTKVLKSLEAAIEALGQEVQRGGIAADKVRGLGSISKAYVKLLEFREKQAISRDPKRRFYNR